MPLLRLFRATVWALVNHVTHSTFGVTVVHTANDVSESAVPWCVFLSSYVNVCIRPAEPQLKGY